MTHCTRPTLPRGASMIELANIKTTDTLGQLRGQVNTMQNEIMHDQPMIGACLNPTVNLYSGTSLVGAVTASNMSSCYLSALIFPENNGCFVAGIIGHCEWGSEIPECTFDKLTIDIPSIKAPNGTIYTSFLPPEHLGLPHREPTTGLQEYPIGFNSTFKHNTEQKNPFIYAYIETSINTPSTLNISLHTLPAVPVDMTEVDNLYLNF